MAKYTIDTRFIIQDLNMLNTIINTNTFRGNKTDNDCLLWKGGTNDKGYPQYKIGNSVYKVYRLVYQAHNPNDNINNMPIHHKCGNRLCVDFRHLQKVTDYDNNAEMHQRLWYEKEIERLNTIIKKCNTCYDNIRQNITISDNNIERTKK